MNETIKKLILFGVGSFALTKEAATKFMSDLEKEGALDKSEGKKVVKQTFKEIDKNLKKFEKEVNKEMEKWEKDHKKNKEPEEREVKVAASKKKSSTKSKTVKK